MKKILGMLLIAAATTVSLNASAQVKKEKVETENGKAKVKPETTLGDKAHNVIHPRHKRSHGMKVKAKTAHGKYTRKTTRNSVKTTYKSE